MIRPGPRNAITDVAGLSVGNAEDRRGRTGVTVVLPDRRAVAAVDVRGGAPGTRETDLLDPSCLVDRVDALVLSGGSTFGLDAAAGVQHWLAGRGRGLAIGGLAVPIVPAAILFDLLAGGDRDWLPSPAGTAPDTLPEPPYRALGRQACDAAGAAFALGNAGAGLGARVGTLKGGLGSASAMDTATGHTVGALVAVNAVGSAVMPGSDCFWAWALEQDGEAGGQRPPAGPVPLDMDGRLPAAPGAPAGPEPGAATTLGVVATDAELTPAEARRLALMAQDGIARAIRPAHTPFDGDTVFALTTALRPLAPPDAPGEATAQALALARLGSMAADALARAVMRGVYAADSLGPWPSYRSVSGRSGPGGAGAGPGA